jgi:aspartate aminotransferase
MSFSKRVSEVGASMTLAMSARSAAMRAEGIDVVNLSAGEPDFPTPAHVLDAVRADFEAGQIKYTPAAGTPALRDAVAALYSERFGHDYERGNVVINCGAKHSLYVALQVLCDVGDEVLFASPYWVSYPEMARLAGAKPVAVRTVSDEGFQLTPEAVEAAMTERTKVILLNSPSNPSGAVQSDDNIAGIAELAARRGVWIVSDEIYDQLCYDGLVAASPLSLGPEVRERTIVVNGVSKTYSMTGWRIGYAVGPADVIQTMTRVQSHETSAPNTLGQIAALAALTGDQSVVSERREVFARRRSLMLEGVRSIPGIECAEPQGAFYVFPKVSSLYGRRSAVGTIDGSLDLSMHILEQAQVGTVPGVAFGDDDYIRLSYATSDDRIVEAIDRLRAFVESLSA